MKLHFNSKLDGYC